MLETPSYIFDARVFRERILAVRQQLTDRIPLVYSIKANAFLLHCLPEEIRHVEVCSPGELALCEQLGIAPERILYSGVMKEADDVARAIRCGADILTAESAEHYRLICEQARPQVRVLLRLTSGNQFGMDMAVLQEIIQSRAAHPEVEIVGLHYYSGTQKKLRGIEKDLAKLRAALETLREDCGYTPQLVEYGPGLSADYFEGTEAGADRRAQDWEMERLAEASGLLRAFAEEYPLSVEMGRFLASPCGEYYSRVCDIKTNDGVRYAILDGGIHQLHYYGQTMAMQVPQIRVLRGDSGGEVLSGPASAERMPQPLAPRDSSDGEAQAACDTYCLCGSLCTVADVLVREVALPRLKVGDVLCFARCGAYSVTEVPALFLSRQLPAVWVKREDGALERCREITPVWQLNA